MIDPIDLIRRFDELPNDMLVPPKIAAIILSKSTRHLRRHPPVPVVRISERGVGFRVGDLRQLIRGETVAAVPLDRRMRRQVANIARKTG